MGIIHPPENAILFIGALFSEKNIFDAALVKLHKYYGDILFQSTGLPWDFTEYYSKELGKPIYRIFVFFDDFIDPSSLADVKLITNEIETTFSKENSRQINLDPGYMTLAKVVLASTKNYSHRIYLGKGIYAEVTLLFKKNRFIPQDHTYNDYKNETFHAFFIEVRNLMKKKLSDNTKV